MIKRVFFGIGANIFDKFIIASTQLVLLPLLSHSWGLKLYGLWVMLSTVPAFLAIGDLGFATAAGTRMTMAEARGERGVVLRLFHSAWVAILISSLVFSAVAAGGAFLTPDSFFGQTPVIPLPELRLTLAILLLYGIVSVQGTIFPSCFRCAGLFAVGTFWASITILIESTITAVLVAFFNATPIVAAGGLLAGRCIGLMGQYITLRKKVPWLLFGVSHAQWSEIRDLLAPAGAVMLLPISQACMLQGTAFALGAAAGEASVPAFAAARTLSRLGQQVVWAVYGAMMPEMSAAIGRRDYAAISMMVMITISVTVVLIIPFALIFGAAGHWIIQIWSRGVIDAPPLMIAFMAISVLCCGFWTPLSQLLLSADRQSTYTMPYVVMAVAVVPATYALAREIGSASPAITMATIDTVMLLIVLVMVDRHLARWSDVLASYSSACARMTQWLKKFGNHL